MSLRNTKKGKVYAFDTKEIRTRLGSKIKAGEAGMKFNFSTIINKPKPKPHSKASVTPTKISLKRKKLVEIEYEDVPGTKLFTLEPTMKKEKEIRISFNEFTIDKTRISKDGKFCIKYYAEIEVWELLYLEIAIEFAPHLTIDEIRDNRKHQSFKFKGLSSQRLVIEQVIKLVRAEFAAMKKLAEEERKSNELAKPITGIKSIISKLQNLRPIRNSEQKEEITTTHKEEEKENVGEAITKQEKPKTAGSVPKPFTFKRL